MAAKEKYPEPTYLEYGFGELEYDVIKKELCCYCGNCIAFCPKIDKQENRPELIDYDPLCGLCYAYCPRTMLDMPTMEKKIFERVRKEDEPLGIYKKASSARIARSDVQGKAQDGGVVTALLIQALESGVIDCAVVTGRDEKWRTVPKVATTAEEIASAAGTKYTITPSVTGVQMAIDQGFKKIGFVGTPCQIQALRKVQLLDEPYQFGQDRIALLVGLFCMENFEYEQLFPKLVQGTFGLKPEDVDKFEIQKGMFRVLSGDKVKEIPIDQTDEYVWKGCGPCFDFAAELADISVGSVGSKSGWSTVLPRTDAGAQIYESALAAGSIEEGAVSEKGLALAGRLAKGKEERFSTKTAELLSQGVPVNIRR
ncbi:MAG TPA: coenzyme F420 hydrogenase [Methanotrichaceae archaeon]|nr:coenzyme F420 hydrogenase [Methanotrichaceae archaeon]